MMDGFGVHGIGYRLGIHERERHRAVVHDSEVKAA